ncbi:MAG: Ig-like domain-containing protein [Brumimicrobium sp.]
MARNNHIVLYLLGVLLLSSCGQVGTITGGPVDDEAPRPISEQVNPPMASKNVSPDEIIIPFDEYIALNKPSENIKLIPNDVTLEPSIKRKSLVLKKIDGEWEENTTYAIYLNRAVKDITENNDSIMVYVFTTGDTLDSLQAAVKIVDAFDNKPIEGITVGLYEQKLIDDTSKVDPRYITSSDKDGVAKFNYLKKGPFYAYAFEDENRNNRLDKNEKRAGLDSVVIGDTNVTTGPIMRLMPPAKDTIWEVVSNEVQQPANWCLSFSQPLSEDARITFEDSDPIKEEWTPMRDSVTYYFLNKNNSGKFSAIIKDKQRTDTITKKYFFKTNYKYELKPNLLMEKLPVGDTLTLTLKEPIIDYDKSKFNATYTPEEDSVPKEIDFTLKKHGAKSIQFIPAKNTKKISLVISPEGVNGYNYKQKDTIKFDYSIQDKESVGLLDVSFDSVPQYGILYLINIKQEVIDTVIFNGVSDQNTIFKNLQPGKYRFYYLIDKNKDGKWTTGNLFESKDSEEVLWFADNHAVRPNWEVKVTLSIKKEKEEEEEVDKKKKKEGE